MPTPAYPIAIICATCGGTNVMRDAWAVWDTKAQDWSLGPVFDHAHCDNCDGETRLSEVPLADPRILNIRFDDARVTADLADGRTITVPLTWIPRLFSATSDQRADWESAEHGQAIRWPDLNFSLNADALLRGVSIESEKGEI